MAVVTQLAKDAAVAAGLWGRQRLKASPSYFL